MTLAEVRERFDRIGEFSESSVPSPAAATYRGHDRAAEVRHRDSLAGRILPHDEVLAVGDARFLGKCHDALRGFKDVAARGPGLPRVTELAAVCDEAVCLDFGRVVDTGRAQDVAARYQERMAVRGSLHDLSANARISLLLPTRGRPELLRRFLESVLARSERPDLVEVVVYADEDDPMSHGFQVEGLEVRTIVGPRVTMGDYNTPASSGPVATYWS